MRKTVISSKVVRQTISDTFYVIRKTEPLADGSYLVQTTERHRTSPGRWLTYRHQVLKLKEPNHLERTRYRTMKAALKAYGP